MRTHVIPSFWRGIAQQRYSFTMSSVPPASGDAGNHRVSLTPIETFTEELRMEQDSSSIRSRIEAGSPPSPVSPVESFLFQAAPIPSGSLLSAHEAASEASSLPQGTLKFATSCVPPDGASDHGNSLTPQISARPEWLPWTLKWYLLLIPTAVSLVLCLVVAILSWYSEINYGLGKDDGSSSLLFGWRFSPTLITVLYCQLTLMLSEDVKRTEPFAHMARSNGSSVLSTILHGPKSWWICLYEGFGRKKTGTPRSWVLVCSTLTYVLGFLVISPLSSSFLTSEDVSVKRTIPFNLLKPASGSEIPLKAGPDTYFRTIGNYLQNVTTSAWIDDRYYVEPFWPATLDRPLMEPNLFSVTGTWTMETSVYTAEYDCEPLTLKEKANPKYNRTIWFAGTEDEVTDIEPLDPYWFSMQSPSGCNFRAQMNSSGPTDDNGDLARYGGLIWSNLSTLVTAPPEWAMYNISAECHEKELLLVMTPLVDMFISSMDSFNNFANVNESQRGNMMYENFTARGELCTSKYYMAKIPVTMIMSGTESVLKVDPKEFRDRRVLVPKDVVDTDAVQRMTMDDGWKQYMVFGDTRLRKETVFPGTGSVLGASYDYDVERMVNSSSLANDARRFKQRFVGELLQNSLLQTGAANFQRSTGHTAVVERRVVVIMEVGILIAALFFVSFLLLVITLSLSRLRYRPLHLFVDPSTPLGVASLVASERSALGSLRPLDQSSKKQIKAALYGKEYSTLAGILHEVGSGNPQPRPYASKKSRKRDWRPTSLRLRALAALFLSIICLILGLAILKYYADRSQLYQKAFVWQASLPIFNKRISTIAPYSVIPTILAVLVGLWWDSMDKHFRSLQPYLSMSKTTPDLAHGAGLQYQTSYWIWAAFRAARNRHWLLLIITFGTTLSQVFIVSMSALFERELGTATHAVIAPRTLEIRQVPQQGLSTYDPTFRSLSPAAQILANVYSNMSINWIRTATIQLTLSGSEPAWSSQGWSFVPIDLSSFANVTSNSLQEEKNAFDEEEQLTPPISAGNVSLSTSAIRGRIECSSIPAVSNVSSWLYTWNLTDEQEWNVTANPRDLTTGYELWRWMFIDEPYNTSSLSHPSEAFCCVNNTEKDAQRRNSAIGYWSPNDGVKFPHARETWPQNFTTKWIRGTARNDYHKAEWNTSVPGPLLFSEVPSLQALNCMPVIESANAHVTVDQRTGKVYGYTILDEPQSAQQAWSEPFISRLNASRVRENNNLVTAARNTTTSYGVQFINTLLGAAQIQNFRGTPHYMIYPFYDEDDLLEDKTFNVRDEDKGLNLDFMSYSMYTLVGKDPEALLDKETLLNLTQRAFATYFQHFVSSSYSLKDGGMAYQPIGYNTVMELPFIDYDEATNTSYINEEMPVYPQLNTNRSVEAIVLRRIEVLRMNAVATWLSVGILIWLALTTILIATLQRTYLSSVIRNFETPADVLVAIAASDNLLDLVRDRSFAALRKNREIRARLGWFVGADGRKRWGVEIAGGKNPVYWIGYPEFAPLRTSTTGSSKRFEMLKSKTQSFGL
ncbi:hypothetical protein CC78DRAFT_503810 [Lojkania enalia]|uniref:Uncharacterized protein n=1 Tax=Lojkania enalia TaxID=147567 RepID=A0A9P4JYV5_9PLEO|nr:hypothetical protein CC78DRAFT_503810 [Didymosphaeria enalia]